MTKETRGTSAGDHGRAGPAPNWAPSKPGLIATAGQRRRQAEALAGAEPGSARAKAAQSEARVASAVAGYAPPVMDVSGPLPYGPARGGLVSATVQEFVFDPKTGAEVLRDTSVRRRRHPRALDKFEPRLIAVAGRYCALVAAYGAPHAPDLAAPGGGARISDGGASGNVDLSRLLTRCAALIGDAVIKHPAPEHQADRPKLIITTRYIVWRVLIDGWSIDNVLGASGWSRKHENRKACKEALRAALTRLSDIL